LKGFYDCRGKAKFQSGLEFEVTFAVELRREGFLVGYLPLGPLPQEILDCLARQETFELEGKTSKEDFNIHVHSCIAGTYKEGLQQFPLVLFEYDGIIISAENLFKTTHGEVVVEYAIIGPEKLLDLTIETEYGALSTHDPPEIEDDLKESDLENVLWHRVNSEHSVFPPISQAIRLSLSGREVQYTELFVKGTEVVVENLLKAASLAFRNHFDWTALSIYNRDNDSGEFKLVLANWSICHSVPRAFGSVPSNELCNDFIRNLYPLFTDQLNNDFGLEDALQWYVISHTTNTVELQILAASTALELLLSRSAKRMNLGTNFEVRIASFLKALNVRIDDLEVTVAQLSEARNKIVHTGLYKRGAAWESKIEGVRIHDALDSILVRLFLAILGYSGPYFDPARRSWIAFSDVKSA
jgi:hypothetical protein